MAEEQIIQNKNSERKSNFELLRIFAMFLIVVHHFNVHGVFLNHDCSTPLLKINGFFSAFIASGGKLGVMLFIMITGYFMINSAPKFSSFCKTYFEMWFYSVLIFLIAVFTKTGHIDSHVMNSAIFPFSGNAYWFMTAYLALYIFSPFINSAIKASVRKNDIFLLLASTVIFMFIPSFFHQGYGVCPFVYFIYFYTAGAFLRLGNIKFLYNRKFITVLALLSLAFITIFIAAYFTHSEIDLWKTFKFSNLYSLPLFITAIWIFNLFKNLKIPCNKYINYVASSVFAVYLIHDNNIIRPLLWQKFLHVNTLIYSKYFLLYMFGISISVFIACIIIDKILSLFYKKAADYILFIISFLQTKFKNINRQKFLLLNLFHI